MIRRGTWIYDLIDVYNELGGKAHLNDVYTLAKEIRDERGSSWTDHSASVIRRTIQEHYKDSDFFKGTEVFYKDVEFKKGEWALLPRFFNFENKIKNTPKYKEGIEEISKEVQYLRKSRDPKLVQERKILDKYTCQACGFKKVINDNQYIIDVHHINPIGKVTDHVVTRIDDLICLCPNCHRIAHTSKDHPLAITEIQKIMNS